ncbi:MAG TPA: NAD(P)-binding domain-containing protein [Terriglobales bacterium]|nr:NAD(P)-binding domain-containing protein [Terriglobales bacterium]
MNIGIIGAGKIGATLAELWIKAGYAVRLASRHPETLAGLTNRLGPSASHGTAVEAAKSGEVVVITVPLSAIPGLAAELKGMLDGKVVLDTNNAYPERDGAVAATAMADPAGTSAWAAALFPKARWVKAFNTVYYKTLAGGSPNLGIPLASDDTGALEVAERLVRDAGFEPVRVGALARGREFEPGTPVYNTGMSAAEVKRHLGV